MAIRQLCVCPLPPNLFCLLQPGNLHLTNQPFADIDSQVGKQRYNVLAAGLPAQLAKSGLDCFAFVVVLGHDRLQSQYNEWQ